MGETERPDLCVSYVSELTEDVVRPFVDAVAKEGTTIVLQPRAPGSYAGLEWFLPTALVVYIAKSYFDGFLKEAGKDHYVALKNRVGALWSKFFGDEREVRVRAIASGAHKVSPNPKYSLALSIVADAGGRRAMKLLVADATSKEDLETAVEHFQQFVAEFHDGRMDPRILKEFEAMRPTGGVVLLAYDPVAGRLHLVDPKTGGPPLLEKKAKKARSKAAGPKVRAKKKAKRRK